MMRIVLLIVILTACAAAAQAQTPSIWITPDTTFTQRDTFTTITVYCSSELTGVKGFHFDFDMNTNGVVIAPADDPSDTSVMLGSRFVDNDTSTFFWNYLWTDSSRLSVDILVLTDSQTVSGPGELLVIRMNTVRFGATDVAIAGLKLRDRFNQPISATVEGSWLKVCQFLGDINADNRVNISDLTYLVNYLFRGGPEPIPMASADTNCNGEIRVNDLTLFVDFLFRGGTMDCATCL